MGKPPGIQAKLRIGAVEDPLEREADRVAEQVMATSGPAPISSHAPDGVAQRKCQACEAEDDPLIQRRPRAHATAPSSSVGLESAIAAVGEGRPLPAGVRDFMQSRLSAEFSGVRVHDDASSSRMASALGARAFTSGPDIFFGSGEYRHDTAPGLKLIAHELTHVVQQGSAARRPGTPAADVSRASAAGSGTVQRKVQIGKKALPDVNSPRFGEFVAKNGLVDQLGVLTEMHESEGLMVYETLRELVLDVQVRHGANTTLRQVEERREAYNRALTVRDALPIEGTQRALDQATALMCCAYPDTNVQGGMYFADPRRWQRSKDTIVPPTMPDGQSPEANFESLPGTDGAEAIRRFFQPNAKSPHTWNRVDCAGMLTAIHYKSLLGLLGPDDFNSLIAAAGLKIVGFSPKVGAPEHPLDDAKLYERIYILHDAADPTKFLMPGDRVYFRNHPNMHICAPTSVWGGEHALYLGNKLFSGFGIGPGLTYEEIRDRLFFHLTKACELVDKKADKTPEEAKAAAETKALTKDDVVGIQHGLLPIQVRKVEEQEGIEHEDKARLGHELLASKEQIAEVKIVWRLNPKKLRLLLESKQSKDK